MTRKDAQGGLALSVHLHEATTACIRQEQANRGDDFAIFITSSWQAGKIGETCEKCIRVPELMLISIFCQNSVYVPAQQARSHNAYQQVVENDRIGTWNHRLLMIIHTAAIRRICASLTTLTFHRQVEFVLQSHIRVPEGSGTAEHWVETARKY